MLMITKTYNNWKIKKIVSKAGILEIEIIKSFNLQWGIKIEINPLGMTKNKEWKAFDENISFGFLGENEEEWLNIK